MRRTWLGRGFQCGQCGERYQLSGPPWEVPESKDSEPVAPRLRQLLAELSAISREPDRFTLRHELTVVESLLRFLAGEGRTNVNLWAVRMWCAYSGENTDYAPDDLNDLYEELGSVGIEPQDEANGTTPEQLLQRLREVQCREEEEEGQATTDGG